MSVHGYLCMATYGHVVTYGYVWISMVTYGYQWLCMVNWLSIVMYGYQWLYVWLAWLCMVMCLLKLHCT